MQFCLGIQFSAGTGHLGVCAPDGRLLLHCEVPPLALELNVNHALLLRNLLAFTDRELKAKTDTSLFDGCISIACSVSGLHTESDRVRVAQLMRLREFSRAAQPVLVEDVWSDFVAARIQSGLLCMVSTGINTIAVNHNGRSFSVGGWGSEIADLGGGYFVGRCALGALLDDFDGRRSCTDRFRTSVLNQIRLDSVHQISEWYETIRWTGNWRRTVASLAETTCRLAETNNDITAMQVLAKGTGELQTSLLAAFKQSANKGYFDNSAKVPIVFCGSLAMNSREYQSSFLQVINALNDGLVAQWPTRCVVRPHLQKTHSLCGTLYMALTGSTSCPDAHIADRIENELIRAGVAPRRNIFFEQYWS